MCELARVKLSGLYCTQFFSIVAANNEIVRETSYVQGFGERNNMSDCAHKIILKTRGDNLQFASSALNMISL